MKTRIGITFDLYDEYAAQGYSQLEIAEFDSEETIQNIERNLQRLGFATERVGNASKLMQALDQGRRWDLVFNICEGLHGTGREALVPAILDNYEIPYTFSEPLALTLSLHKDMGKRVMRDVGVQTPEFALVEHEGDIARVDIPFPLFAKPVAEGTSKGIDASCHVQTPAELRSTCLRLLETCQQPVLVERYLPGREYTVGILGSGSAAAVFGGMEIVLREGAEPFAYTYHNKEEWETLVEFRPITPEILHACAEISLPAWRVLSCRDAGRVDLREDADGRVHLLEVNPLPGLNEHSDLSILSRFSGISYPQLIERIMESVLQRLDMRWPEDRQSVYARSASA